MGKLEKLIQEIDMLPHAYVEVQSKESILDGKFTAEELRKIAEAMEILKIAEAYGFGMGE